MEHIQEHTETIDELETASEWNEEEERKYWIARMGKQAALDLMANGRVGTGNLDSIAMMKQEDQIAILDVASQYSCLMKLSMDKITGRTEKYFKAYAESPDVNIPTFHGIEETMNVPLLDKIKDGISICLPLEKITDPCAPFVTINPLTSFASSFNVHSVRSCSN